MLIAYLLTDSWFLPPMGAARTLTFTQWLSLESFLANEINANPQGLNLYLRD